MTGEEKKEGKRVGFGPIILTSAFVVVVVGAVLIWVLVIHPAGYAEEFARLIAAVDGRIVVPLDDNLSINAILFHDFEGNEQSVDFDGNPGHEIEAFELRERDDIIELDMLGTLSSDSIDIETLPEVPQEINVKVFDKTGRGKVDLFIITDRPYPGGKPLRAGVSSNRLVFKAQVGRKGISGFVSTEAGGFYPKGISCGIAALGEGPVAVLVAVRFQGSRPIGRSKLVLIKRKGIMHPDDTWFDKTKSGYFSLPFLGNNLETSRVAFVTPIEVGHPKLIVSTLDYKLHYNVSELFKSPVAIDHWGRRDDEINILYVREEGESVELHKVMVGTSGVVRLIEDIPFSPVGKMD